MPLAMSISRALSVLGVAAPVALGVFMFTATGTPRGFSTLPPVPVPDGNPITEDKRVLGKILFFEEQLSSDNTVACATCHQHFAGGTDPRQGDHPGLDALFGTADDGVGSPGVIAQNEAGDYEADPVFGVRRQVTARSANSVINAAYSAELFWDGRAPGVFTDPDTGEVLLTEHAALESQAVGPPLSDVEMAYHGRDWAQITDKLAHARPLAMAINLPSDTQEAVLDARSYPELFRRAFGDREITPARIGMALATYQRTLLSDQSPFDEFISTGNQEALTAAERRGWNAFQAGQCLQCHATPLLTDDSFRNIGLRPVLEDLGREGVTGLASDRGAFKTPSLRNTGLKRTWMHNGSLSSLADVVAFYTDPSRHFPENIDPVMNFISLSPQGQADLVVFLRDALTDPRVATGVFPFDAPDLFFRPGAQPNPAVLPGPGRPDSQGRVPALILATPPLIGSDDFKIGLRNVGANASATLVVSASPPANGVVSPDTVIAATFASDPNGVEPVATAHWPVPFSPAYDGAVRYAQWRVHDPAQAEPALSRVARIEFFCGFGDCTTGCPGDFNRDQALNIFDLLDFLTAFNAGDPSADLSEPLGAMNVFDLLAFLTSYNQGCP